MQRRTEQDQNPSAEEQDLQDRRYLDKPLEDIVALFLVDLTDHSHETKPAAQDTEPEKSQAPSN